MVFEMGDKHYGQCEECGHNATSPLDIRIGRLRKDGSLKRMCLDCFQKAIEKNSIWCSDVRE